MESLRQLFGDVEEHGRRGEDLLSQHFHKLCTLEKMGVQEKVKPDVYATRNEIDLARKILAIEMEKTSEAIEQGDSSHGSQHR